MPANAHAVVEQCDNGSNSFPTLSSNNNVSMEHKAVLRTFVGAEADALARSSEFGRDTGWQKDPQWDDLLLLNMQSRDIGSLQEQPKCGIWGS